MGKTIAPTSQTQIKKIVMAIPPAMPDAEPTVANLTLSGQLLTIGGISVDDTHTLNTQTTLGRVEATDGTLTLKGKLTPRIRRLNFDYFLPIKRALLPGIGGTNPHLSR